MQARETNDPAVLALGALVWTLAEDDRAGRLLALTGLSAEALRARVGQPELRAAVLRFLEGHEPDLIACAAALGVAPTAIVTTREALER